MQTKTEYGNSADPDKHVQKLMALYDRVLQTDNAGISEQWAASGRSATSRLYQGLLTSTGTPAG